MSEDKVARCILNDLDEDISSVVEHYTVVDNFIQELLGKINAKTPIAPLQGCSIMHGGSAFESLAVNEKVDFDVIVVLGKPFVSENFNIKRSCNSGFYTLEWKPSVLRKIYKDKGNFLSALRLQNRLFKHLQRFIKSIQLSDSEISCKEGLAALSVDIRCTTNGQIISIDLVPLIACHSWGQCSDLRPIGQLPRSLRQYIDTLNKNASPVMFFSPSVPTRHKKKRDAHRLCNVSFSQLEKKFLTSNTDTRDMVRLVKFVAEQLHWKIKYGLQSFFVKRVAIKYSDELDKLSLWDGYKKLLGNIRQELSTGTIDGYFVKHQEIYRQRTENIAQFQNEILRASQMNASQIRKL